jgi:deazaflavin-dependent oxidoreductase (nitroreductase family)
MTQSSEHLPAAQRPVGWQKEHMQRYVETNGEDGHIWHGRPTLLLTTTGRNSGNEYTTALIYGQDGERFLVVGSRGGAPDHPQWYQSLVANPDVTVQVKADKFRARARTANAEEKPALWKIVNAVYPSFAEYQTRTEREIPVIILERV